MKSRNQELLTSQELIPAIRELIIESQKLKLITQKLRLELQEHKVKNQELALRYIVSSYNYFDILNSHIDL